MSGVVIGLIVLILLIVVGAVIYFSTTEEEKAPSIAPPVYEPPDGDEEEDETPEEETFSIVNGWIHEGKYQKMLKVKNDGTLMVTGYRNTDQAAKWNFEEADRTGYFYLVSSGASAVPDKVIRITRSVVQLTNSKDATSRLKLQKSGDSYRISDRTGRYFIKVQGSQILSTDDKDEASVFMIEPSQFYITMHKTEETGLSEVEGFEGATTMVLTDHSVECEEGGVAGLSLVKDGDQYRYDFKCMKGIDTSGDIITKVNPESTAKSGQVTALTGQPIDCGDKLIKGAQLLYQNLEEEGQIAYSYSCLPTPLDMNRCETKTTDPTSPADNIDALAQEKMDLVCPTGKGITNIKMIKDANEQDIKYEYKCCPTA
jgi:hypothetical protein